MPRTRTLALTLGACGVLAAIPSLLAACSSDSPAKTAPPTTTPGTDGGVVTTGPLALAAGEAAELTIAEGEARVVLSTNAGEKFVAIVASTKQEPGVATNFSYAAAIEEVAEGSGAQKLTGCALATWNGEKAKADPEPTGTAPTVGATRSIRISSGVVGETITAKAVAVGKRAVVWADVTAEHPATLDQSFIDEFLADFEDVILPRERLLFGAESDIDGDGRIALVFSPLTKDSAVAFFSGCDLVSLDGCPTGNEGEFLYLTPPADIEPPYNTPNAIKETLAHELGHLIHFNRKVLRNDLGEWPDGAYMIEGFGAFTQDVSGYQAGNFYVAKAGLEQINDFSIGDVFGFREAYDAKRDGVLRGGGYWVVRYLYDRGGGDHANADGSLEDRGGPSFIRSLLDAPTSVTDGVAAKASLADVSADFYTALAMSGQAAAGLVNPTNACFAFQALETDPITSRQRGGDPHGEFHGQKLTGPATKKLSAADGKLRSGGVEYLTFDGAEGTLGLRFTVDSAAAPRVRIARLK